MAKKDKYQVSLKVFLRNGDKLLAMAKTDGFFDFPGGRIEVDEFTVPLTQILKREIKEEAGDVEFELGETPVAVGRHLISVSVNEKGESIPEIHVIFLFFEARLLGGEVQVSEEHVGFEWLEIEQLRQQPEKYFKSGNLEGIKMYLSR